MAKKAAPQPVAAYLRISTADQSHDSQRAEVARWLDSQGIDPEKVVWYVDTASGRQASRPELDRLRADIASGVRSTVVVYKLDRLARDLGDGLALLSDWCKAGVRVASVTQAIDVSGTVGRMVAAILLGVAELEWTDRRDRQAAGIAAAKGRGVYRGRAAGSTKAKPQRARDLQAKGATVGEIATALGISTRTVFRYLDQGDRGE